MLIHCCGCDEKIEARLTDGGEVYPHRRDLSALPFWMCDTCGNFVGCHYKTNRPTMPLGCMPTPEINNARRHIHAKLDPIWQGGKMTRKEIYKKISERLGRGYHTANIRSIREAREVYRVICEYG